MESLNNRRNEDMMTVSWMTAALQRQKRMPSLEKLLMTPKEQKEKDEKSRGFMNGLVESGVVDVYTGGKIVPTVLKEVK